MGGVACTATVSVVLERDESTRGMMLSLDCTIQKQEAVHARVLLRRYHRGLGFPGEDTVQRRVKGGNVN